MAEREVRLGLIGGGLMGRELASTAARWIHLDELGVRPRLVHVCDVNPTRSPGTGGWPTSHA